MSHALIKKAVLDPCTFYHPKTVLCYIKQRRVTPQDQEENGSLKPPVFLQTSHKLIDWLLRFQLTCDWPSPTHCRSIWYLGTSVLFARSPCSSLHCCDFVARFSDFPAPSSELFSKKQLATNLVTFYANLQLLSQRNQSIDQSDSMVVFKVFCSNI